MGAGDTARIEAFSDGVFAIAITLLVLDIKVPHLSNSGRTLASALVAMWPTYLAFVTSFMTILIMWINNHRMFTLIGRADDRLMFFNGLLLLGVTIVPFPTALVAEYLRHDGQRTCCGRVQRHVHLYRDLLQPALAYGSGEQSSAPRAR